MSNKPFRHHRGLVLPLDRANVDTDAIIPKQYLKSVKRTGFGPYLFDSWRYLTPGELGDDQSQRRKNPDFVMNRECYTGASILLARANFGCGSSREHAVWALLESGFRCVIAPGFADIFYNNALRNGLLPVSLPDNIIDLLFGRAFDKERYTLTVNLENTDVSDTADSWPFEMTGFHRQALLNGLDEIGVTLQHADAIRDYESRRKNSEPWLFESGKNV